MNYNDCSGFNLVALASSLAILISKESSNGEVTSEQLVILAAFFTALADNLAIIAASR